MMKKAAGRMKAIKQAVAWLFGISLAMIGGPLIIAEHSEPANDFLAANPWVLYMSLSPAAVLCAGGLILGAAALGSLSLASYHDHRARGLGLGTAVIYSAAPALMIAALVALTVWAGIR